MTSSKTKERGRSSKRFPATGLLMILGLFAVNAIVALILLAPKQYAVVAGSPAPTTILATRTIENTVETEARKRAAREAVPVSYVTDAGVAQKLVSDATAFFTAFHRIRETATQERIDTVTLDENADIELALQRDERSWESIYPGENIQLLFQELPIRITDRTMLYNILAASDEDVIRLQDVVLSKLEVALAEGVTEPERDAKLRSIKKELQITTIPIYLKSLGDMVYDAYFQPTNTEDAASMQAERERAAAAVEPVFLTRGTAIVEKGDLVTDEMMQILLSLDLVKGANENKLFALGAVGYIFLLYLLFLVYLLVNQKDIIFNAKRMLLVTLTLGLTILLEWPCYLLDPRVLPTMLAVMLSAALISAEFAAAVNVLLAFSIGFLAGGRGANFLTATATLSIAASLVAGQTAIFVIRSGSNRTSFITSGFLAALMGILVVLSGAALTAMGWRETVIFIGCMAANPIILSVFCVGLLAVWENAFDIVTLPRLNELMRSNHPLIKRMMTTAPGTYHHSMTAASLAEGAAEAIGANAPLARVGAIFHDVGKLRRPNYFVENQTGRNIHDTLPPQESAELIIAHQQDAEALLTRYKLPQAIKQIAYEHHGTTMVAYFYYKAKKAAAEGEEVDERNYRYPGMEPTTKESAIVMLADSCEAAVRSLSEPTREDIAAMLHKVIKGKLDDGQLKNAPLTLAELTKIEKSFFVTITGLLHERIRYPEEKK